MKRIKTTLVYALIMGLFLVLSNSCSKDDDKGISLLVPVLTTTEVTNITQSTAVSGGNITDDGGATVTVRGVCWSTNPTPTIKHSKTADGDGAGSFPSNITGLAIGATYYVRAYATNSKGTGYGSTMSFYTDGAVDVDGNVYKTVTIATQRWMAENLKTTKLNDGTAIPNVTDGKAWKKLTTPGYCWYDNDLKNNGKTYGALYNFYAVETNKLCPTGWHVPTDAEYDILIDHLGGKNDAGNKLKETGTRHWLSPNYGATNETGFTALPSGDRIAPNDIGFRGEGEYGGWWRITPKNPHNSSCMSMKYNESSIQTFNYNKEDGLSVRCIKD